MIRQQSEACLAHFAAAERIMEDGGDLSGLARLALVIDLMRQEHSLAPRDPADLRFADDINRQAS